MNRIGRRLVGVIGLAVLLTLVAAGSAKAGDFESAGIRSTSLEACAEGELNGTVVDVDVATGELTVWTGSEACTVQASTEGDHPIASLLGGFFALSELQEAGQALEVELVEEDGEWRLAGEAESAVTGVILAVDASSLTVLVDGDVVTVALEAELDEERLGAIDDALALLLVEDWAVSEDAEVDLSEASTQIAELHEDGLGYGVLVKLLSLSSATGEPLADLVEAFTQGGLGGIFEELGRPDHLGVGHLRRELREDASGDDSADAIETGAAGDDATDAGTGALETSGASVTGSRGKGACQDRPGKGPAFCQEDGGGKANGQGEGKGKGKGRKK